MLTTQEPYYLDGEENKDVYTYLENQISVIPPHLREGYRDLEVKIGEAFVSEYGEYLNDRQKEYFGRVQTIFIDPERAATFSEVWNQGISSVDKEDSSIDGQIYLGYTVGGNNPDASAETFAYAQQHWAGRIVTHPLASDEIHRVDSEWLMEFDEFFDKTKDLDDPPNDTPLTTAYTYSNAIGSILIHEKVHGIQDYKLPLPILEAAAHYYQRELPKRKNWKKSEIYNNMQLFADLYGECVAELGEDVHRLIFGNLQDVVRRQEVLAALKSKFSLEKIKELSTYKEYSWQDERKLIHWEVGAVEEIIDDLKLKITLESE